MSGRPATAFAPVGQGQQVGVKNFSATSGLSQTFELVQADDQFAPDKAFTATQKLIDQDKVAAMTGTIGTPAVLAIRPLLEKSCVPFVAGQAGAASVQQPGKFPWTITFTLPSALDARIWAASVAEQFPEGAKVAMFYANDSSGKEFLAAAQKYIGETNSEIVSTQTIEDTDSAAPASQVTTLRSSGATVLLAADQPEQLALCLVDGVLGRPVRVRVPVAAPGDLELMQVRVRPAHRRLHHLVQHRQVDLTRHVHTTPDRRRHLNQHDLQLEDLRLHRHARSGHE